MEDTLIAFGSEIKAVEETAESYKFGGFLVVFDTPDISSMRDKFTKSTDYDIEDGDTRSIYYNHGLDGTFGKTKIGKGKLFIKDAGIWLEGEIQKRTDYLEKHISKVADGMKMTVATKGIEAPLFGLSSGALSHLVEREVDGDGHRVTRWNLGEASITPTPCAPQTGCTSLKSLLEAEGERADLAEVEAEIKRYDPRQPRDQTGKWSDGAGGISQGHAAHVMRSEGISDAHASAVLDKIKDGTHKTREDVLAHIERRNLWKGRDVEQSHYDKYISKGKKIPAHELAQIYGAEGGKGPGGEATNVAGHIFSSTGKKVSEGDINAFVDDLMGRMGSDGWSPASIESRNRNIKQLLNKAREDGHIVTDADLHRVTAQAHENSADAITPKEAIALAVETHGAKTSAEGGKGPGGVAMRAEGARQQSLNLANAKTPDEAIQHIHPDLQKRLAEVTEGENATVKEHARDAMLAKVAPHIFKSPTGGGKDGAIGREKADTAMIIARGIDQGQGGVGEVAPGKEATNVAAEVHSLEAEKDSLSKRNSEILSSPSGARQYAAMDAVGEKHQQDFIAAIQGKDRSEFNALAEKRDKAIQSEIESNPKMTLAAEWSRNNKRLHELGSKEFGGRGLLRQKHEEWQAAEYARNRAYLASRKSDDETDFPGELKHLTNLETGQLEGSRFADHTARLLEANREYAGRFDGWSEGFDSVKAGRAISAANHDTLKELHAQAGALHAALGGFLEMHAPNEANASDSADDKERDRNDSYAAGKSLSDEAIAAIIRDAEIGLCELDGILSANAFNPVTTF